MIISDIKSLELELTSRCNAACPQCPRTNEHLFAKDLDHNREITVKDLEDWLPVELLTNLKKVIFKGTFSDPLISKHFVEIIEWIKEKTTAKIRIHTNGSLRNKNFWQWLAKNLPENSTVIFAIDGLSDTHSIYRVNTRYEKIIENAKIFIENGGNAHWQFIIFQHNKHQVTQAEELSKQLGFQKFFTIYSDRTIDIEFTKKHNISEITNHESSKKLIEENILKKQVTCQSLHNKEIFINWDGEVFPCCMTGIYATKSKKYFDFIVWKKHVLKNDFNNNSLKHHTLKDILSFYDDFYKNVEGAPKLVTCGKYCGNCN
jgi:MoaA/NifB/PqqE/SkfB family radical SAM enzyme